MEKDQRDLLRAFNERKAKYLIVGGYAVSYFTEPRVTKDLDIFIDTSDQNVGLVYAALAEFGAPIQGMTPEDLRIQPGDIKSANLRAASISFKNRRGSMA